MQMQVQTLTTKEIADRGGKFLSSQQLDWQNTRFVRGSSFPKSSRNLALSICESYEANETPSFVMESLGIVTIWRAEQSNPQDDFPGFEAFTNTAPTYQPITIVYVDDSLIEAKWMENCLQDVLPFQGYSPTISHIQNPCHAVATILKIKPDIIFLDLNMPIVNGYEITAQLRRVAYLKEVPIIIVTGSNGIIDRARAKVAGATDFIAKPIDGQKILNILHRIK